ncbi:MAG: type I-G CRISPR-associated RAMP protein Csb1/Cas7g [Gammaproteobacteria bacterium]
MSEKLTFDHLSTAITSNDAAIRLTTRLQPAGGPGSKVFPPTHSGGVYAWEMRRTGKDEVLPTILLDSVQSQANRMEQALKEAYPVDETSSPPKCRIPTLRVDFNKDFPDIGYITTLDAPHRIADAIFRDSQIDGKKFRESNVGQAFINSTMRNATGLFQYCPHALVFGVWDSTGSAGGLGNKFQRALVSEIVGIGAVKGVRTSSRLDPVLRRNPEIYETESGNWTSDPDRAGVKKEKDRPVKYGKLSELNLGNVTPDFVRYDPKGDRRPLRTMYEEIQLGDVLPGGVTIEYAIQTAVLSLPALRRLHFPIIGKESKETTERNNAAHTVLAALALAAIAHQREQGYDLRSRCLLVPEGEIPLELVKNDGRVQMFSLKCSEADTLLEQAIKEATQGPVGLPWQEKVITLKPEDRLVALVRKSRETLGGQE